MDKLILISKLELDVNLAKFMVPFKETINGQINFDFKGKIAWSNRSPLDPAKFSTGIQFTENPELQVQFIRQMIKVFGSN